MEGSEKSYESSPSKAGDLLMEGARFKRLGLDDVAINTTPYGYGSDATSVRANAPAFYLPNGNTLVPSTRFASI